MAPRMPLAARRTFRLAFVTALALALAYALGLGVPFLAPLFAVLLTAGAKPPPGPKQLLVLLAALSVGLGVGVLLGPLLQYAPASAMLAIALGLFVANRIAIVGGRGGPGTVLALGVTVIPAASSVSQALASALISAMVLGVAVAVLCQWLVYPLFPEDPAPRGAPPAPAPVAGGNWLALRATLIVMPALALTLTNPATYMPLTIKSILLGREASDLRLRGAAREMIGATALGGLCAIIIWSCLGLAVELWFFFGWVALCALVLAGGAYQVWPNSLSPGFWTNTLTTALILLGSAVQDSAAGKDVYQAFAVRMALFLAVALYAVAAMTLLERLRLWPRLAGNSLAGNNKEALPC